MAEVKKCDRCGKIYEKNEMHKAKEYHPTPRNIVGIAAIDKYLKTDRFFELCDDCLTEFFDYFMGCD